MKQHIRQTIVARAVIIRRGKILLTRMRDRAWYFLPGGHVQKDELVERGLGRELKEEFDLRLTSSRLLGVNDNHFDQIDGDRHHELGIVFRATVAGRARLLEHHIIFEWVPVKKLSRLKLLPQGLGGHVARALKTGKVFLMVKTDRGIR